MDFIRRHKLIVATVIIQIIALPAILLLVRQEQDTRTAAQASTALYFEPTSGSNTPIEALTGESVSLDLMMDPGTNYISFAKVEINYDPTVLEPDPSNPVVVNSVAFPVTIEGPLIDEANGKIQIVVSVGSDQTKVIQEVTKVLTLNMVATGTTNPDTDLTIGQSTQLLSTAPQDTSTENVLETSTPATIVISEPTTPTPTPIACTPAFDENGGSVTIEAENYDGRSTNGTSYRWALINGGPYPQATGDILFMRASPNDGNSIGQSNIANSPEISYDIDFETTGTYYVYVRGSGNDVNSHVVHMGLDGNYVSTMNNYYIGQDGSSADWQWKGVNNDGSRATVNITTPGIHTIHFWMRDSGAKIDRFRLTQNANWLDTISTNESSKGPDENPRTTCPSEVPTPTITPEATEFPTPTNSPTPTPSPSPTPTPTSTPTPTPTSTPTPSPTAVPTSTPTSTNTPTPTPSDTVLVFYDLKLHGLGSGGDNPNPTSWGTLNPLRPTRDLTVEMYNTTGSLVETINGEITYTGPTTGMFNGNVIVPNTVASGSYTIKIRTPYYLTKLIPGFLNLVPGTSHNITPVALIAGDVNNDNQLRVSDYDLIMDCYADLLPARNCDAQKKIAADISDDGKVNQDDYNLFLRELSVQSGD